MNMLSSTIYYVAALMVMAAVYLMWWKSRSPWLLVALASEVAGFVLRIVMSLQFLGLPMELYNFMTLSYFAFAVGLLGYAVVENTKTPGGNAP